MKRDVEMARLAALRYRAMGLVPLPSKSDDKKPLVAHGQFRDRAVPESVYDDWDAVNIQLMTGAHTSGQLKILVVDCDGDRARKVWRDMCRKLGGMTGRVWVASSPSGGRHFYFSVPPGLTVQTRTIWGLWDTWGRGGDGSWAEHQEIKVLGEGSLVVAPPSIHVALGGRYRFCTGFSPTEIPGPDIAPGWLMDMLPVATPRPRPKVAEMGRDAASRIGTTRRMSRSRDQIDPSTTVVRRGLDEVQDSIPARDKLEIAASWGLRLADEGMREWMRCHRIDAEDHRPSAGFQPKTGRYKDHVSGRVLSFFQLGVALGAFDSVANCARWCEWRTTKSAIDISQSVAIMQR